MYKFTISYLDDNGVVRTYVEKKHFFNEGSAYFYFDYLCDKFNVGPYYYLCEWEDIKDCTKCKHRANAVWQSPCDECFRESVNHAQLFTEFIPITDTSTR